MKENKRGNNMDWTQVLTILGGNTALFMWATRQARTDFLHLDRKLEENRKEAQNIIKENQKETQQIVRAIQTEVKDFHDRLCSIEERNKK
jgi:predicted nuclease with TOPRIM domain